MSRVANSPVVLPKGVEVLINGQGVNIKGAKGSFDFTVHPAVTVAQEDGELKVAARKGENNAVALSGTTRALLNNMVTGVTQGFEKKLELVGVGYRAQVQGKVLNLSLGFSHPVAYEIPDQINIETPTQTQVVITGIDKQKVGQVAANIRAYRPPEPYKGKGVKYADEQLVRKEAKKK